MTDYAFHRTIDRNSPFVRLHLWAWPEATTTKLDTCRLFWGFLFLPLNLFVRVVGFPFFKLFKRLDAYFEERTLAERKRIANLTGEELLAELRGEKVEKRNARTARFFATVGGVADRVVSGVQRAWPVLRWPYYALLILAAVAVAGGIAYGVYALVNAPWLLKAILITAGAFALLLCIALLVWFYDTNRGQRAVEHVRDFGGALRQGGRGVHSRTCIKLDLR